MCRHQAESKALLVLATEKNKAYDVLMSRNPSIPDDHLLDFPFPELWIEVSVAFQWQRCDDINQ